MFEFSVSKDMKENNNDKRIILGSEEEERERERFLKQSKKSASHDGR